MIARGGEGAAPRPVRRRFDVSAFLFNAAGRSGRTAYLVGVILAGLLMKSALMVPPGLGRMIWGVLVGFPGFVIWGVLTSRRLHDLALAGWWFALVCGVALFAADGLAIPKTPLQWAAGGLVAVATALLLLWPGQRRLNRFGPPPG